MNKGQQAMLRQVALHASVVGLLCLWFLGINRTADLRLSGLDIEIDKIEGERDLLSKKEVHSLVTKELPQDIMTQKVARLDLNLIERLLLADSRILDADVFLDAQQKLNIDIVQRRPILRVMNQNGDDYYVDQVGDFVRTVKKKATRVPVVTGYVEPFAEGQNIAKVKRLSQAHQIVSILRKDNVLKALVEQMHFEKKGRVVLIPKVGDEKIILSHIDELEGKMRRLKEFYRQMARTNSWGEFDEIDISYNQQVVGRNNDNP